MLKDKEGNTISDEDAQKEIDNLRSEREKLESRLAKAENQVEEKEGMINKLGNETGEYRKKLDTLDARLAEIESGTKPPAKNEEGSAKTPEEIAKEEAKAKVEADEAEADRLSSLLDDEDDEAMNDLYDQLDRPHQIMIDTDVSTKRKFLESYLGDRAVKRRSWRKSANENENEGGDAKTKLESIFDDIKNKRSFTPSGSHGPARKITGRESSRSEPKVSKVAQRIGVGRQGANMANEITSGKAPVRL